MEDILLLFNEGFFHKHGVLSIDTVSDVPDCDSVLFLGSHRHTFNPQKILDFFEAISKKPFIYSIICGKTDGCLNKDIEIPRNIKKIYCNNVDYSHDVIKFNPHVLNFDTMNSKIFKDEKDIWFNHYKAEVELTDFDDTIKKHIK